MKDFNFISPTKIYFGKDSLSHLLEALDTHKKVLIVYGQSSIKKIGLYDKVISLLSSANIGYFELSGIRPNPEISKVKEGLKIVRENDIDLILAVGGGSVIDTAKSIAASFYYDGDPFDLNLHKVTPTKALPIGVILTISASGSELSDSCVIMDDDTKIKQGFNVDCVRPSFAIMNPEFTYSVNKYQTACGIVDIISHSLERYFSPSGDLEVCDTLALSIIKDTIEAGKRVFANPNDYDARAALMLLGSYSHNGLTSLGKVKQMPIHKMEHALSAYDIRIAHGAGLSILIPLWMEYSYKKDIDKFVRFSEVIFGIKNEDKEKCALNGINLLREYFKSIGMPIRLNEVEISQKDVSKIVDLMSNNGTLMIGLGSINPLTKEEIIKMLESIL